MATPAAAAAPRRWLAAGRSATARRAPARTSCAAAKPPPDGDGDAKHRHNERIWDDHLAQLRAYAEENGGSFAVPLAYPTRELGEWVHSQRKIRNMGQLSAERITKLDAIGFPWDPREKSWEERYAELERYAAAHGGSADVSEIDKDWLSLGRWLGYQRACWLRGSLSPERIDKLQQLGVDATPLDTAWDARYAQLEAIAAGRGDGETYVSCEDDAQHPGLTDWLKYQRRQWRAGKLPAQRVAKLQALGVQLDTEDAAWQSDLDALTATLQAHGGSLAAACDSSAHLAKWVNKQQLAERDGRLSADKRAQLDGLGVDWRSPDATAGMQQRRARRPERASEAARWEARYNELLLYAAQHGGSTIVPRTTDDPRKTALGQWVNQQRMKHNRGELSPERVAKLEAIHFAWHLADALFFQHCDELAAYKAAHRGSMNVKFCENRTLHRFIATVRNQARTKGLDSFRPDQLARLNALGFDWQE
jgi:hypothetical protein